MRMVLSRPLAKKDPWCSGLTCGPVKAEIAGSNPVGSACVIKLIPTGAQINALFSKVRQWAHEEIPQ